MKLRDLNAHFVAIVDAQTHRDVDTLAEADGVMFQCPLCASEPGRGPGTGVPDGVGCRGVHYILCWFCGVDPTRDPKPGRWRPVGTSLDDLTLEACPGKTRSVWLNANCCYDAKATDPEKRRCGPGWHGFVTNGDTTDA